MLATRPITPLPTGTPLVRFLKMLRFGEDYARVHFADTPQVLAAKQIIDSANINAKTAVGAATTANAPGLQATGIIDPATVVLLQGWSAFDAALPRMRHVPVNVPVSRQIGAGTGGGWVDQGAAMPVVSFAFDTLTFTPARIGAIAVLADALLRSKLTDPIAREVMLVLLASVTDTLFLDPTEAGTAEHPASITHAAVQVPGTANVKADLDALLAAIATSGRALTWIASPVDLARIASALGAAAGLPRTLLCLPVIPAPFAPLHQVTLVDLAEIVVAAGEILVDLSDETSIAMESAPTMDSDTPTPTQMVSMFQTNSTAFAIVRFVNWAVVRPGAVSYCVLPDAGSPA